MAQIKEGVLNDRQKKFCLEYLKDFNATQAAIRAGYASKNARKVSSVMLTNANVQAEISKLNKEAHTSAIMDIQEIQERLTRIARGETIEETVVVEGTGQGYSEARVVQKKVTPKDQVKALELLGKANGMFIEKHQVEVNEGLIVAKEYLEGAKNGKFKKS